MSRVVFRTDASDRIGTGHVVRCLSLARSLRSFEIDAFFVSREHKGHLCNLIEENGFQVVRLPVHDAVNPAEDDPAAQLELGATWQRDAEQTKEAILLMGFTPDWLVVDHYSLDHRWESRLRSSTTNILAIDDLANRPHDCNALLDQNLVAEMNTRYAGKVPENCTLLLGPKYALLQPGFAELRRQTAARRGPVRTLLIFFGGFDSHNLTGRALAGFLKLDRRDIHVDVVVPSGSPHAASIRSQSAGHDCIRIHGTLPSLAPLMSKADLAIGAGGTTAWERLCLGLPSIVVAIAANQQAIAEELSRLGLIHFLGATDGVDEATICRSLEDILSRDSLEEWSRKCFLPVDGRGAARVGALVATGAGSQLQARRAEVEDEALLLTWANDPLTRKNAFSTEPISEVEHHRWLGARLRDTENGRLYIVETSSRLPVGMVRFSRLNRAWELHFSLAPIFRGCGLGLRLVETGLQNLRADTMGVQVIQGQVKSDNCASSRIFQALGFEAQAELASGVIVYQRIL